MRFAGCSPQSSRLEMLQHNWCLGIVLGTQSRAGIRTNVTETTLHVHQREEGLHLELGDKLRHLRRKNKLTLKLLAQRAGLSYSYISQVERGLAGPSISALRRIAGALGITLARLFDDQALPESQIVVRKHERRVLTAEGSHVVQELLALKRPRVMEPMWTEIEPGGTSGPELYSHAGEEFGILLSGTLKVWVGDEQFTLEAGDSMYFESTVPHRFANAGETKAVMVWVVSPPSW